MSTLKTHNLQSPDAGSVNIVMAPNAGMVVAGLSTYSNQINVGNNIKLGNAGIITATTFVGNLTGNPTGTIQTAAQPNITSVGTLTGLTVSGDVSIADKIIHTGDTNTAIRFPTNDTITFETSGNEGLRLTSGGSIGIGSISVSYTHLRAHET